MKWLALLAVVTPLDDILILAVLAGIRMAVRKVWS